TVENPQAGAAIKRRFLKKATTLQTGQRNFLHHLAQGVAAILAILHHIALQHLLDYAHCKASNTLNSACIWRCLWPDSAYRCTIDKSNCASISSSAAYLETESHASMDGLLPVDGGSATPCRTALSRAPPSKMPLSQTPPHAAYPQGTTCPARFCTKTA